ncbi:MAG: hypothetical protein ABS54_09920 [Hyphomicrobium sp. SCN 65-11]|nr:MAG: hypothetical protein ABS54_09920 [Hyphomicrobium sp. SCN 65-11]
MKRPLRWQSRTARAVVYGILPCLLGLGAAQYLRWTGSVWLAIAGNFWPIILTTASLAILIRLIFSPFDDRTIATSAWLTLFVTWFYVPMWATAIQVPYAAALVDGDGHVRLASEAARQPGYDVWLLTNNPRIRIVHNASGTVLTNSLNLDYKYAEPYIATRRHQEDLFDPISNAAAAILQEEARKPRTSRIALIDDPDVRKGVLEKICRVAVGDQGACPIKMSLIAQNDATALGATWSKFYTEKEAIQERHVPTLMRLLTQSESPLLDRDQVFATLLEGADSISQISQVAQRPYWLSDDQLAELIGRITAAPDSGNEAAAVVSKVVRLKSEQRRVLRAKAIEEASIATLLEHAVALRISDAELVQLAPRMRAAFSINPGNAVRALELFGERLPPDTQNDAVSAIVKAKAQYALMALAHLNFSTELRDELMRKVLTDADYGDFAQAKLSKEKLQGMFTPAEMRGLIEMAVKRSETSESWMTFALGSLAVSEMTPAERRSLLTGLLFKSPRAALEFVSENRRYLEPREVNEVTRDYTQTIAADLCLHLSHRNANRRMEYFSEEQLQIFRDCAQAK